MTEELCARIIDVIPSKSLKNKMRELDFRLSEADLLSVAFQYAPDYDTRLGLLSALEQCFSGELQAYTARLIAVQREMLAAFQKSEPGVVFELHIRERPEAWDERYLCAGYADALAMIPLFYQSYACEESAAARYTITKRRVLSAAGGFAEDGLGELELLPGPKLASVELLAYAYAAEGCDGGCLHCDRCCVHRWDTVFPCFVGHGDAVRYTVADGKGSFGLAFSLDDRPAESVYVIPLESDAVRTHAFENIHDAHTHVFAPLVERIEAEELPEPLRADYEACRRFVLERWPKSARES